MAWYGPCGTCGCSGESGSCQCPVVCECTDPENAGKSLVGKKFTIDGFPAVIELKTSQFNFGTSKYVDYYVFVSGLHQFNGTYDMRAAGATGFGVPDRCTYSFSKTEQIYVQIYRTTTLAQESSTPCNAGLTQIFDGFEPLRLVVGNGGGWSLCTNEYSIFRPQYPFSCGNFGYFNITTSVRGSAIQWLNQCVPGSASSNQYLEVLGAPRYQDLPLFIECTNHSAVFQVNYSIETIVADSEDRAVSGWNVEVSEIKDPTYVRITPGDEDTFLINGLDELNGMYFLPNVPSQCRPNDFTDTVNVTWEKQIISLSDPCTIVETGETGSAVGKLVYYTPAPGNASYITLLVILPDLYGYGEIELTIAQLGPIYLDCFEGCSDTTEYSTCLPTYNQKIFKACWAPELS
jgi:hypothetical protein